MMKLSQLILIIFVVLSMAGCKPLRTAELQESLGQNASESDPFVNYDLYEEIALGTASPNDVAAELDAKGISDLRVLVREYLNKDLAVRKDLETIKQALEDDVPNETQPELEIKYVTGIFAKLIQNVAGPAIRKMTAEAVKKLYWPGDHEQLEVIGRASIFPNAFAHRTKAQIGYNTGLALYARNLDEYYSVIAHELTHKNPDQLKAADDSDEVKSVLSGVSGYNQMEAAQQEEIRADLGSIQRMVKAGLNPWAAYDFEKRMTQTLYSIFDYKVMGWFYRRFFKKSFEYSEAHPIGEVRMAAMKAYITYLSKRQDLSQATAKYTPLPKSISALKYLTLAPRMYVFHRWSSRIQGAVLAYLLLTQIGGISIGEYLPSLPELPMEGIKTGASYIGKGIVGLSLVIIAGVGNLAAYSTVTDIVRSIKNYREKYQRFVYRVENLSKQLIQATTDQEKAKIIVQLARTSGTYLNLLDSLITDAESLRPKWLDIRWRAHRYHLQIVGDAIDEHELLTKDMEPQDAQEAKSSIMSVFAELPPWAFEDPRLGRKIASFAGVPEDLSNAQNIPQISEQNRVAVLASWHRLAYNLQPNAPPQEILTVLRNCFELELYDSAQSVFKRFSPVLLPYVFEKDVGSQKDSDLVADVVDHLRQFGTQFKRVSYLQQRYWDRLLQKHHAINFFKPIEDRIALDSLAFGVPIRGGVLSGWTFHRIRTWINKGERKKITKYLSNSFQSLDEYLEFIDKELKSRKTILANIRTELGNVLVSNPSWVNSLNDVDKILARDEFWPELAKNPFQYGTVEYSIANIIQTHANKFPEVWKYNISQSDKIHNVLVSRLQETGRYPSDYAALLELWKKLTNRGVSSTTDSIFLELTRIAPPKATVQLAQYIDEGRVWDQTVKERVITLRLIQSDSYRKLQGSTDREERLRIIDDIIKSAGTSFPERGSGYFNFLERLSRQIRSTPEESQIIHKAKSLASGSQRQQDLSYRLMSDILTKALTWKKSKQWQFVLFLRGAIGATPTIEKSFGYIGTERVRRLFQILPSVKRAGLLDSFLDSPVGLLGNKIKLTGGYTATIVQHVMANCDPKVREIGIQVLDGFLFALKESGNGALRSYVLSYLLSFPPGESRPGKILKDIFELFGSTGIKLGQFLAAAELFPPEDTKFLQQLQEKANEPNREDIYADLRDITKQKDLPWTIHEMLGAASQKYAVRATVRDTGEERVLKVLRLEAIASANSEFRQLEIMADRLVQTNGRSFGVFRAIVQASKAAIQREQIFENEVVRSQIARDKVYQAWTDVQNYRVPRERLIADRLSESEFAKGYSILDQDPAAQDAFARMILKAETEILFQEVGEGDEIIAFDPDRHPGNFRLHVDEGTGELRVGPIDFGQLIGIRARDRDRVFSVFALAQILKETGSTEWAAKNLYNIFNLENISLSEIKKKLSRYFPAKEMSEVSAYYSVLAALYDLGRTPEIVYFDYVRAVIQCNQYEGYVTGEFESPKKRLTSIVEDRVKDLLAGMYLTPGEKAKYGVNQLCNSVKGLIERSLDRSK